MKAFIITIGILILIMILLVYLIIGIAYANKREQEFINSNISFNKVDYITFIILFPIFLYEDLNK